MKIEKIWTLCFSATGNTDRVVTLLGKELAAALGVPLEQIAFTRPVEREQVYTFTETDLVVVGSPTYAGKLPNKILPDFREKLRGNGALAVAAVTFGNRAYDNSLAELCAVLEGDGFHTVAAGAFVGRHAFTDELAYGRPGWSDEFEMKGFAKRVSDKVKSFTDIPTPIEVPGDPEAGYYQPRDRKGTFIDMRKVKPVTGSKCVNCGVCARVCPMGAIDLSHVTSVPGICIKCNACVKRCTKGAKYFDDKGYLYHKEELEAMYGDRRAENQVFL